MARPGFGIVGFTLVTGVFGACGGAVESDAAPFGSDAGSADGGVDADGAAEAGDGTSDAVDAADGDGDVAVQSCAACSVASYGCGQSPMESFDLIISDVEASGCLATNPQGYTPWALHCDPLEVCGETECFAITEEAGGVLTWKTSWSPKVTCWPVKK